MEDFFAWPFLSVEIPLPDPILMFDGRPAFAVPETMTKPHICSL
jgi:hypothetical protein